ncbi:hypothetical protein [Salinarimonas chemoclinalis]|uniref:hypothetical protein n=1 Tax=Salinarimonas chemoclinalis TaxID=3241599 RepID=UPI0035586704
MATYPTDRKFESSDAEFGLIISSEAGLSYGDFASALKDIEKIFSACAKELSVRSKTSNKKKSAMLVIKDYKHGSIEIISNPYFQGIISGVAVHAICLLFIHVLSKTNDAKKNNDTLLQKISKDVISGEKLADASGKAVVATTSSRKALKEKKRAFGLQLSIRFEGEIYELGDD